MKMTMASSCSYRSVCVVLLAALLFEAATHTSVTADVDPLLPVCKSLGGASTHFGIDFCMSALGSDNRSRHAGSQAELSSIAVDLLTANATSTAAKIRALIWKDGGNYNATAQCFGCLVSCKVVYTFILERQTDCIVAIRDGKFSEAIASLEQSASEVKGCENGFSESNVVSPLTAEDDSAFKLAKLAIALITFPR